jgi:hypothetical protein
LNQSAICQSNLRHTTRAIANRHISNAGISIRRGPICSHTDPLPNLIVATAKLAFGWASGTISILSDGFHSLTDAASNVAALVGMRVAYKPPDANHPYGHRKYETLAAAVIASSW